MHDFRNLKKLPPSERAASEQPLEHVRISFLSPTLELYGILYLKFLAH